MQAKRILNLSDLVDNRSWFITRFNKTSDTLKKVQASNLIQPDFRSIMDVRKGLKEMSRKDSFNN